MAEERASVASSKRWSVLCKVYEKALTNWETLLTQPISDKDLFRKAFRAALSKHPEAIEAASTSGGMLQYIMRKEFPTLLQEAPESMDVLIKDVVAGFRASAREEFSDFLKDLNLESKLLDLEQREASLKLSDSDKVSNLVEPSALLPEEEMRAVAVESLLVNEAQLAQELEKVRAPLSYFFVLGLRCI